MSAAVALAPLNANAAHKSLARPCTSPPSQYLANGQVHIGEATKLLRQMWTPSLQACAVNELPGTGNPPPTTASAPAEETWLFSLQGTPSHHGELGPDDTKLGVSLEARLKSFFLPFV